VFRQRLRVSLSTAHIYVLLEKVADSILMLPLIGAERYGLW
jgi:hypothetical protein